MQKLWFVLYNYLVIPVLFSFFFIGTFINNKIKRGFAGRKGQNNKLKEKIKNIDNTKNLIWFHSASLGEFEQAKPIIKKIKEEKDVNILITFFSPSGYDNSQKYPYADLIAYLPFDFVSDIKEFLEIINPNVVIFMRYDIWPNLVWQFEKKKYSNYYC